jgi:hypothetical protein
MSLDPDLAPEGYKLAAEMALDAMRKRMATSNPDPFGEQIDKFDQCGGKLEDLEAEMMGDREIERGSDYYAAMELSF